MLSLCHKSLQRVLCSQWNYRSFHILIICSVQKATLKTGCNNASCEMQSPSIVSSHSCFCSEVHSQGKAFSKPRWHSEYIWTQGMGLCNKYALQKKSVIMSEALGQGIFISINSFNAPKQTNDGKNKSSINSPFSSKCFWCQAHTQVSRNTRIILRTMTSSVYQQPTRNWFLPRKHNSTHGVLPKNDSNRRIITLSIFACTLRTSRGKDSRILLLQYWPDWFWWVCCQGFLLDTRMVKPGTLENYDLLWTSVCSCHFSALHEFCAPAQDFFFFC